MTEKTDLAPLKSPLSGTASQSLMPSPMRPSAAQVDSSRTAVKKLLALYPDYGKAPPEYVIGFAEALSHFTASELALLMDPRKGLAARCKFLPTVADAHEIIREERERAERFKPAPTAYKRLGPEPGPWDHESPEHRRRVVLEKLGYVPGE